MKTWLKHTLATQGSLAPLFLRLGLAVVILPHGLQKAFGWFGGFGFEGSMAYLTDVLGIPWIFALAAVLAETVGPLLLLAGVATRFTAASLGITMFVAMVLVHAEHGFFMNWFGAQAGEGIEYFLLAIGISLALLFAGGGRWSLDAHLAQRLDRSDTLRAS